MRCERCQRVMSFEEFRNVVIEPRWTYKGWRCLHCGEVIDALILQHRTKAQSLQDLGKGTPVGV